MFDNQPAPSGERPAQRLNGTSLSPEPAANTQGRAVVLPRWSWLALMALCLIGLCSMGLADEPIETDLTGYPAGPSVVVRKPPAAVQPSQGRPVRLELAAELANYDRDFAPDGWVATLMLLDATDCPVAMRAHAVFELSPGRIASDGVTFVVGNRQAERWSVPLETGQDGTASVRLSPKHGPLPWTPASTAKFPGVYARSRALSTSRYPHRRHDRMLNLGPHRQTLPAVDRSLDYLASDRSSDITGAEYPVYPALGALTLRLSVPTEGTFESVTVVELNWPIKNVR